MFYRFRVCATRPVVEVGSEIGKCEVIVIIYARRDSPPSLPFIFSSLLWLCMEPQNGGVVLHPLTTFKILW